jgi:hypothetical protein
MSSSPFDNVIGYDETWFKVLLRHQRENTASNIFKLEGDDHTVTISKNGTYYFEFMVITTTSTQLNAGTHVCAFLEINGYGLQDVLERPGNDCSSVDFLGNENFGGIITHKGETMVAIVENSTIVVRFLFISTIPTDLMVNAALLKITKV